MGKKIRAGIAKMHNDALLEILVDVPYRPQRGHLQLVGEACHRHGWIIRFDCLDCLHYKALAVITTATRLADWRFRGFA